MSNIWKGVLAYALVGVVIVAVYKLAEEKSSSEWYLICAGKDRDYLVKSSVKPYTKDGFIYINGDSYITPESGMTCKPVKSEVVHAAMNKNANKEEKI